MNTASPFPLIALDSLPEENMVVGELLTATAVPAANVVRDIRENIRNLTGGRMIHYERLVQSAVDSALADLAAKAQARGYAGVIGLKISHPNVVDGGVEVIVYGNGFTRREEADGDDS
ncbi:MAG: heavy metal-binding domain-containing protein [Caldilineaceae bacterium]|nr:heavy metal-binding domain-containing protein [Caldilineaceae bacterium]